MVVPTITLIAPEAIEASLEGSGRPTGLSGAAQAFVASGIRERLAAASIGIDRIETPAPVDISDRIVALGEFNGSIASAVRQALAHGSRPVLMGGTCSHLPGMIAGLQQALDPATKLGLLWLDAHGDFNTPATTPSGMLGGMPVAVVAGLCHPRWREGAGMTAPLPTNRIMMVDVRNLDPEEEELIRATDVQIVRLHEPDAFTRLDAFIGGLDAVYVHIDADILDISLQPNHPTAEPGGLDVEQTLAVVERAAASGKVVAFGLVSVNPDGPDGHVSLQSGMDLFSGSLGRWLGTGRTV